MLPPGLARLATAPVATASPMWAMTMGMLVVGDAGRRPFRCQCWWRTLGDDQIDLEVNKLGRKGRKALVKPVRLPIFVADIPRLHIAALLETLPKGVEKAREGSCRAPPRNPSRHPLPPCSPRLSAPSPEAGESRRSRA